MKDEEKKNPENEDKTKEQETPAPESEKEKEGTPPEKEPSKPAEEKIDDSKATPPEEKTDDSKEMPPEPPKENTDDKQGEENGEGAEKPEHPEADDGAIALLDAKAQLAAFKSGVKADAVEDAVCLAIHDAKKAGIVDENSIAECLKGVLSRHPEWKAGADSSAGFRIGADSQKESTSSGDEISKIFGNK